MSNDPEQFGWINVSGKPMYFPSPDEIAATCFAINRRWSEGERRRRAPWGYTPPVDGVKHYEIEPSEI